MYIDSHCHIHLANRPNEEIIQEAREQNISQMLCVALNDEDAQTVKELVEAYPEVYMAAAWHPNDNVGFIPSVEEVVELCSIHEKCIAVGETGLDYFRTEQTHKELKWQRDRFVHHIEAGKQLDKPVIIHTREAMDETLDMLKVEEADKCGGILHCFTGELKDARKALDLDFYISFSGILTFNSAKDLQGLVSYIPKDKLLIETDTPYLAPTPFRGRENQPAYVVNVAHKIADLLGEPYADIAQLTSDNFRRLFKFNES